ncbi:MAG: FCD domain-containing protein [Pseudomonadota bacterium]|nr:FCD domain-containing protein [Pseudomonadota bacterium]
MTAASGDVSVVAPDRAWRATRKLADIVHEQLFRLITRGEFPKGCKLPPEGELAGRFGVSRPVVRDALAKLKVEGYVRSQRGSGSIVLRGEAPGTHGYPGIRTVSDLLCSYEFRITVERATAAMAAERREAADLEDLDRTLDRAITAIDNRVDHLLADLNFDFHRAVARATHNPFYLRTVEMIPNFIGAEQLDRTVFGHQDTTERAVRIHEEHVAVSEAIHRRDPEQAVREMEAHIAAARDFVLKRQEIVMPDAIGARNRRR